MPLDQETKEALMRLQDAALDILGDLAAIFPPNYRFTFVARDDFNGDDTDIVLTNDEYEKAMEAFEKNKTKMEGAVAQSQE